MKKAIVALSAILLSFTAAWAQRSVSQKEEVKTFEEAMTRMVEPEIKVFIRPKVADLSMISESRQYWGPYTYKVKTLTEYDLENFKKAALYRATKEADADVIVATIFDSYILDSDNETLVIDISGFPAKYVNFRDLGEQEVDQDMIMWVYPAAWPSRTYEQDKNTQAVSRN